MSERTLIEEIGDTLIHYYEQLGMPPGWLPRPYGAADAVAAVVAHRIEGTRGTGLCDCDGSDDPPNEGVDHHCDCAAVTAAASLLHAYTKTRHAGQCEHSSIMDEPWS